MKEINVLSTNQDIAKILASRLKQERISQSLKQEELALMADVKPHVIRNLEQHSKISLDNLISIMRALRKTDVFETMFDFEKEHIEVDAFAQNIANKKKKQRVYDRKSEL
ncbi:helix-turn-helix transcriptional regulator [Sulfurimonas sp. SAG-AH-194-C21]|nr:helix-turn-helix transcriptional regulator [Sulfurimonas sp. SAG-AH-194-C21]MDF1884121.1 helix-turn-helix transcriptional regulator [Sulfurimonas sp. SAG-AH-194-C21]